MRRTLAPLVAATVSAVLAAGALAPAASAASGTSRGGTSMSQADRRLSTEQRKVVSLVTAKDRALARVVREVARKEIAVGQAEVLANVAADRAALDALRAASVSATTVAEVRALSAQVHAVRPEVYAVVVNGLRQASRFQELVAANAAAISDLAGQADAKRSDGFDVSEVDTLLASAADANDEALALAGSVIDQGVQLTARGDTAAREAFSADVAAAGERLDTVDAHLAAVTDALAAMVPVAEQPVA